MNIGVGIMASRIPYVEFRQQKSKLNEKTSLMDFKTWKNSESIEMILKKETFSIVDPLPTDHRSRTFSLDPDFSTKRGCFAIKKLHIICILAVILTAGVILTIHQKTQKNNQKLVVGDGKPLSEVYGRPVYDRIFNGIENNGPRKDEGSPNRKDDGFPNRKDDGFPNRKDDGFPNRKDDGFPNRKDDGSPNREDDGPPNAEDAYNRLSNSKSNKPTMWDPTIDIENVDLTELKHLVQPLAYKIFIRLPAYVNALDHSAQQTFSGNVSVILRAKDEIKYVIIGASDLRIVSVNMISLDESEYGENYDISIDQYDADEGTLILHLSKPIRPNIKYTLQIVYNGDIQQMPYGLFQITSNITETGEIKTIIATNTNVPFARTIFPCFDLPTQTAKYELHICRSLSMITESSGTYIASVRDGSETCTWENFQSTDTMPLHFFGFIISDYTFRRVALSRQRTLSVWTPYKDCDEISYALEVGPRLIDILEEYFGIDLPVENINIYPVPSVFPYLSSKLGLIIAQESDICIKDQVTSEAKKEHVVKNLAAHLIEQWTGYINFEDDQDNWLKESIVQYLQYIATDLAEPKWKVMEHFFADVHQTEMDTDIINTHKKPLNLKYVSHLKRMNKHAPLFPIKETSVFNSHTDYSTIVYSNTDEIQIIPDIYSEIFDRKDIDKGICLIRMIHHVVTDRPFKNTIEKFIEYNKSSATTSNDFWNILTTEAGTTVPSDISLKTAINEWIYNREYPIVKVIRDYTKNTVSFQQFVDTNNETSKNRGYFRYLPVSYTTEEEKLFTATSPKFWIKQLKQVVKEDIYGLAVNTWILVNPKQTNLYRVNYDEQNWNMLQRSCLRGEFPAEVRAQLIDDALFLARRGQLSYDFAMDFTKSLLKMEGDYVVWNSALHHFDYMRSVIDCDENEKYAKQRVLFQEFLRSIITPMYTNINFHGIITKKYYALDQLSPAEHNQLLVESEIFRWACDVNIEKCSSRAKMDFNEWKRQRKPLQHNSINPNLRYGTLCSAMRIGDESDFDFLYQMYSSTSSTNPDKFVYLKSLYCYKNISQVIPKILSQTLLSDFSVTHLNQVSNIWQALIENPIASTAPFDYMLMYWKSILKTYADFTPIMRNIIEGATINIHNEEQFNELLALKDSLRSSEYTTIYEILFVSSRHVFNRIAWKNNEMPQFLAWLEKTKL